MASAPGLICFGPYGSIGTASTPIVGMNIGGTGAECRSGKMRMHRLRLHGECAERNQGNRPHLLQRRVRRSPQERCRPPSCRLCLPRLIPVWECHPVVSVGRRSKQRQLPKFVESQPRSWDFQRSFIMRCQEHAFGLHPLGTDGRSSLAKSIDLLLIDTHIATRQEAGYR